VVDAAILVTIGNYGIGYGTINDDGQLIDVGVVQLSSIPDINATLLFDSFFKQIEVLGVN
jgi:hypothetical protein